ncbi:putative membrane protein YkoI [Modicisalibacter xianhensis]|uniref:Putative membrane protein YkoI n=1 Tax=Modicisalibacter xianhensis TaxID=442341 RepID=A0A4R8G0A9_9GAMM|nr:PepSY domain-containing protein [Halomonas xianhensis]TDX31423.1 putative membrane protein YkoI [Halomonas xianhensis]
MKRMLMIAVALVSMAGAVVAWEPLARADDEDWRDLHDQVQAGRLVSLPSVLDWLEARYEGTVLETELERDDGRAIYEIEMLGPQGQMVEFEFDASNGELLGIEGVNIEGMRR